MFSNLNGSIGLGMAVICLGPFQARWDFLLVGLALFLLIYAVRYSKGWARLAALGAVALSAYVLLAVLPGLATVTSFEDAIDLIVELSQSRQGRASLFLGALAILSVTNALVTCVWGQSRQTARSFEKLGI